MSGIKSFFRVLLNKCTTVYVRTEQVYFMRFRFLAVSPSGFLVESRFQLVIISETVKIFYKRCDKFLWVLMIDVCKIVSERDITVFHGGIY